MGTLGTLLMMCGLAAAAFGAVAGFAGGAMKHPGAARAAKLGAWGYGLGFIGANLTMVAALLMRDFSVQYVAQVGSHATPTIFTIVSLWSALEGSLLFWGAILGTFLIAFAVWSKDKDPKFVAFSTATMLAVACFFAFLVVGPANPFAPTPAPIPLDGPGPNPYLQNHILMIVHPPALYLGYVGLTVPFGIALGALLAGGKLPNGFGQWLRRWTLVPWLFLTLGIVLGGWWAYEVLGWGGYWAWDPVENASFLPWLTATAFMHSSMVQERKRGLKTWTLCLVLVSFWLTILGTFMTRSGIFNSVHAFTQSEIGPMFLGFLAVLLVVSVAVVVLRAPVLEQEQLPGGTVLSRQTGILVTNLVLAAFTFTVLLGTVLPLIVEAVEGRRISVGEPYFNRFAVPLSLMLLLLMGVGPALPWGSVTPKEALKRLAAPAAVGVGVVAVALVFGLSGWRPLMAFGLAGFAAVVTVREMFAPAWAKWRKQGANATDALSAALNARRRFGGHLVHLGVIGTAVGIAASSAYSVPTHGTVKAGETFMVGDHPVKFVDLASGKEPHRQWVGAKMELADGTVVTPRLNYYERSKDPIGTPAVRSTPGGDVYLSVMSVDPQLRTATYRAWVFPLVGWIWWSMPLFVLGTFWALWPQRRRSEVAAEASTLGRPAVAGAAGAAPALKRASAGEAV